MNARETTFSTTITIYVDGVALSGGSNTCPQPNGHTCSVQRTIDLPDGDQFTKIEARARTTATLEPGVEWVYADGAPLCDDGAIGDDTVTCYASAEFPMRDVSP